VKLKNKSLLFCLLIVLINSYKIYSQSRDIIVKTTNKQIIIDGLGNDKAWENANEINDFFQHFPSDSSMAELKTTIKIIRDESNIYLLAISNTKNKKYVVPSLRRDWTGWGIDGITFVFDTYNDRTNAFFFGTNPEGVQRESLLSNGATDYRRDANSSWDTKWTTEAQVFDNYIINEIKIPLKFLNFPEGAKSWGFNAYRFDSNLNEWTTWIRRSRNQQIVSLAFLGNMIFEDPLGKSKAPLAIIPYVNGITSKDFVNEKKLDNISFGGDAKIPIGNGLNLDLTLNPDFSQVEVDDQVVNLTRFEVSLPEKRQFFIQNSDLFTNYGDSRDGRPFFSRRIGVAKDLDGNTIENKIIAGARLSGKIDEDWRIGFLHMITDEDLANEIPSNNNTVFSIQKKMFTRSNISLLMINRENRKKYDFTEDNETFNRLIGLDYNLASPDNVYVGRAYFHKSFKPDSKNDDDDSSYGVKLERNTRESTVELGVSMIGEDFKSDLGFIRRTDLLKITPEYKLKFYPINKNLTQYEIGVGMWNFFRPNDSNRNSDRTISPSANFVYRNGVRMNFRVFSRSTYLYGDFDPTGLNPDNPIPGEKTYRYTSLRLSYNSDVRKNFSYRIEPDFGQFYNGMKYSIGSTFNWRFQPFMSTSLSVNYDHIALGKSFPTENIWLIRPKIDFTFTKNIFWSSYVQYSSQAENLGINSRLQWRFAPLSDLYIVYNDNYITTDSFIPRQRSLNLKLTYWLNI
jgi:hypothetical protein|tara:strand:- start:5989 stop:8208 length:2220 start_codon:yes stop_codon:yes gene_type:complete